MIGGIVKFFRITFIVIACIISLIIGILPYYLLRLIRCRKVSDRWLRFHCRAIARAVIFGFGGRVIVDGVEHVPTDGRPLCIISNHQGIADIPVLAAYIPLLFGFVAKKSLKKVPILGSWCIALRCIFIDRKSPRSSMDAMRMGVESIKGGYPLLIFPEGTRSQSIDKIGSFKAGSIKLATRAKATVLPVSVEGTSLLWEESDQRRKRKLKPQVFVKIHPPVDTSKYAKDQEGELSDLIEQTVSQGWSELQQRISQ